MNEIFLKPLEILGGVFLGGRERGKGSVCFGFCFVLDCWFAGFFQQKKKKKEKEKRPRIVLH